jgi:hypothetical protein
MNRLGATIAAVSMLAAAPATLAACRVTKVSGDYLYSSTLQAEGGEFFCHGAGVLTFAADGRTITSLELDKCSGEGEKVLETSTSTYTFDKATCVASVTSIDSKSGTEIKLTLFFDSRATRFRGVAAHNLEGVTGSVEGEKQ